MLCPVLGRQYKRDINKRERIWRSITKVVRLLEHVTHEEKLTKIVWFTVKKRKANGGSCCSLQLPRGISERRWMCTVKGQEGIVTSCSRGKFD